MGGTPPMRRPWTQREEDRLRELYLTTEVAEVARLLNRKPHAVRVRAHRLGLKISPEEMKRRRAEGLRRTYADPEKRARIVANLKASITPEERERRSRHMTAFCTGKSRRGQKLSEQARLNRSRNAIAYNAKRIGLPRDHPLRKEYDKLIRNKCCTAEEARQMIQVEIAKLPAHERALIKVEIGQASIVNKVHAR